jgi:hypothetical protein
VAEELAGLMKLKPSLAQFLIYGPVPSTPFYDRVRKADLIRDDYKNEPEKFYRRADGFTTIMTDTMVTIIMATVAEWLPYSASAADLTKAPLPKPTIDAPVAYRVNTEGMSAEYEAQNLLAFKKEVEKEMANPGSGNLTKVVFISDQPSTKTLKMAVGFFVHP